MEKYVVYEKEREKLLEIFANIEPEKKELAEGLIDDAAFLFAENTELKRLLDKTGTVRVSPANPSMQKPVAGAAQYLKNVNSYAVVMKTLAGILNKANPEAGDELEEYQ